VVLERLGLAHGEVGEDLAVDLDAGLAQAVHEARVAGVAQALLARGGVDAADPQAPEVVLLVAAVAVLVVGGVEQRLLGDADALAAQAPEALGALQDLLVSGAADRPGLGSRHGWPPSVVRQQALDALGFRLGEDEVGPTLTDALA
jgi:hypothetical protein